MLQQAILIEPNRERYDPVRVSKVWDNYFYFDTDNKLIDPEKPDGSLMSQAEIETLPNYGGKKFYYFEVGKTDYIPYWDTVALEAVVSSKKFARPDMQAQIDEWFDSGLDSTQVYQKVIEADGLVKPSDVGLDTVTYYSEPQKG